MGFVFFTEMLSSIFKFFERIPKSRDFLWVKIAGSEPFAVRSKDLLDARQLLLRIREDAPSIKNHDLHTLSLFSPGNQNQKISFCQSLDTLPESSEETPFLLVPPLPPSPYAPKLIFVISRKVNKKNELVEIDRKSYEVHNSAGLSNFYLNSGIIFDAKSGVGITSFLQLVDGGEYYIRNESVESE